MKVKEFKAPGIIQNNDVHHPYFPEMKTPGFIQPINSPPLHFTITSSVDEPFIVDWQLDGE